MATPQNLRNALAVAALAVGMAVLWTERPAPPETRTAPENFAALQPDALVPPVPSAALLPNSSTSVVHDIQTPPLPPIFDTFRIVAQDQRPSAGTDGTEFRRIVRAPFKYPWLRIRSVVRDQRVIAAEVVVADQLVVTLQPGVLPSALAAALAAERIFIREKLPGSETLLLQLPDHELDSVDRARARLASRADIFRHVDPNGLGFGAAPNDPRFGAQWALRNTGQNGGMSGCDVNASALWRIVSSAPKVLVAVLDSGMDFLHPDLAGIAWQNPGEIPGNGIDDDGNGHTDDVNGWDFVNSDNLPADDHDHGSHVTGIIGARRDNATGIAGIADPVSILPVKILNFLNTGFTTDFIAALDYTRLLGARVLNLSLQNFPAIGSLQDAFDRAEAAGIVICAAAGNQGANNDATPNYPSSFANANIIAVGNHDRFDTRWAGVTPSNFGLDSVDLFAPGREVVSTVRNGHYTAFTGTSMSVPHVSAVAAMVRALNPEWTAADVKSCILDTVSPQAAYDGICATGGRLDAEAAIRRAIKLEPDADPDGDSVPSLVEYALGNDPLLGNAGGLPVLLMHGGTLEFTYPRPRTDVSYSVEASDDFITWDAGIVNQGGPGSPVTATAPAGIAGQRFLHLKITPLP